ncbi:teashirt homolog 3-like protein [Lates japonicus]|uniref:Teashirt homolog 3-like protein n=1 Tax=Lates japonicus TaxID=270547 RepID=A0AAD3MTA1_LATJO|nr:teashirt homolog 3-like protein [Lates japonicus]
MPRRKQEAPKRAAAHSPGADRSTLWRMRSMEADDRPQPLRMTFLRKDEFVEQSEGSRSSRWLLQRSQRSNSTSSSSSSSSGSYDWHQSAVAKDTATASSQSRHPAQSEPSP